MSRTACIWAISEQNKLSENVKAILLNSQNNFWVSKISLFEIAVKLKIGKMPEFKTSFPEFVNTIYLSGYQMLPMKDEYFDSYNSIAFDESHRDPFDRYLLACAHFEKFSVITKDEKFQLYANACQIVW